MKFIARLLFSLALSLQLSKLVSGYLFEQGQTSYLISTIGLTFALVPSFYNALYNVFATKLMIVTTEEVKKKLEQEIASLKDEQ